MRRSPITAAAAIATAMRAARRHAEGTDQREPEDRRRRAFDAHDRNLGAGSAGTRRPACGATRRREATAPPFRATRSPCSRGPDARSPESQPAGDRCAGCADTDVPGRRAGYQGDDLKQHRYRKDLDPGDVKCSRELAIPVRRARLRARRNDSGPEVAPSREAAELANCIDLPTRCCRPISERCCASRLPLRAAWMPLGRCRSRRAWRAALPLRA